MNRLTVWLGNRMADWFPNSDEPMPAGKPAEQTKGMTEAEARAWWWFRNPFHDLTHYKWGMVGQDFENRGVLGTADEHAGKVFNPEGGWLTVERVAGKRVVGYTSWVKRTDTHEYQFYWGVRPNGAWGVKLRRKAI